MLDLYVCKMDRKIRNDTKLQIISNKEPEKNGIKNCAKSKNKVTSQFSLKFSVHKDPKQGSLGISYSQENVDLPQCHCMIDSSLS
jgi:hypothetical protein